MALAYVGCPFLPACKQTFTKVSACIFAPCMELSLLHGSSTGVRPRGLNKSLKHVAAQAGEVQRITVDRPAQRFELEYTVVPGVAVNTSELYAPRRHRCEPLLCAPLRCHRKHFFHPS